MLINYVKNIFYLVVGIGLSVGLSPVHAGAYEDFFQAIKADNAATVQSLLAQGFDPNAVDQKGQPALYLGLRDGSFKVCAALLDHPQTRIDQP
ncbi:MAG: ankyrin repeat domain-containing protein, partial [Microbacteriaceae bacterium]|nr:ankyrin repeat domain-containing protein [Burkholderiaceae bacterium]